MLKHFKQRGELFQTNYPTGTFSVTNWLIFFQLFK
jgi:hypothetical protein